MYYGPKIYPADEEPKRSTIADLDNTMDNARHTIGCPWEALDWADDEQSMFLTLPNCSTVEFNPWDDRATLQAFEVWASYTNTAHCMSEYERATQYKPHQNPLMPFFRLHHSTPASPPAHSESVTTGVTTGVTFRIVTELRNGGGLRTSAIY